MYVKIKNGKITKTADDLKLEFPDVQLWPKEMPERFEDWVKMPPPPQIPEFKKIKKIGTTLVDGAPAWNITYEDDLDQRNIVLQKYGRDAFYARLYAPITMPSGDVFTPDDKTLTRLNNKSRALELRQAEHDALEAGPTLKTKWVFDTGEKEITLIDMQAMALAADDQWQPYFDRYVAFFTALAAGTFTSRDAIDQELDSYAAT